MLNKRGFVEGKFYSYLFWFGDLNYRLSMPDQEVREKILKEDWNSMIEADQVCIFEFVWKYFILM